MMAASLFWRWPTELTEFLGVTVKVDRGFFQQDVFHAGYRPLGMVSGTYH